MVTVGKTDFLFVADRVRAIRDTPRRRYAEENAQLVGPMIMQGEDFSVRWIVRASDKRYYYITPWWTRVLAEDVERIRDVA